MYGRLAIYDEDDYYLIRDTGAPPALLDLISTIIPIFFVARFFFFIYWCTETLTFRPQTYTYRRSKKQKEEKKTYK